MIHISNTGANITILFGRNQWERHIEAKPKQVRLMAIFEPLNNNIVLRLLEEGEGGYRISTNRRSASTHARPGLSMPSNVRPNWPSHESLVWESKYLTALLSTGEALLPMPAAFAKGNPRKRKIDKTPQLSPQPAEAKLTQHRYTVQTTAPTLTADINVICRIDDLFFSFAVPEHELGKLALLLASKGWLKTT